MKKILLAVAFALAVWSAPPPAEAAVCGAGDKAQVLWKGTWYPATVVKAKGTECFIHYDGYGSNWDEWVGPNRIRITSSGGPPPSSTPAADKSFSEGDAVDVKWKGTWYPAHVLSKAGPNQWKIHYDGYDSSWDEVVGPGRIRSR